MRKVLCTLLVAGLMVSCASAPRGGQAGSARHADTYCNPLDVPVADPFVFRDRDGTYYLYGTFDDPGLPVWSSKNLVDWQRRGTAFLPEKGTWSRSELWAPEVFEHRGKYYMHFTARGEQDREGRPNRGVVLAEGTSPVGPFREVSAPWLDPGRNVIDGHVFRDENGKMYLYTVRIDHPPEWTWFEIHVQRLGDDLRPAGESVMCIRPSEPWEGKLVNEGPFVVRRGDTYFLTYSANAFDDPNYSVGYATAKSPMGPWTKSKAGPVLKRTERVNGPGHHGFVQSPDGSEWFVIYHRHRHTDRPGWLRELCIDRVRFTDRDIKVDGPTTTPQPMPSGAARLVRGQNDEFSARELDRRRWTVFNEDPSRWSIEAGKLTIRTADGDVFEDRADVRNLFLQRAPRADFDVVTGVAIDPEKDHEAASLYAWQDSNNYVKVAVVYAKGGAKLEVAKEADGHYAFDLAELNGLSPARGLEFRISKKGDEYRFFVRDARERGEWRELGTREAKFTELHVGIAAGSPVSTRSIPATFDFVRFLPAGQQ